MALNPTLGVLRSTANSTSSDTVAKAIWGGLGHGMVFHHACSGHCLKYSRHNQTNFKCAHKVIEGIKLETLQSV